MKYLKTPNVLVLHQHPLVKLKQFYKNNLEDINPFCGATHTPWTSCDACPGFQSQSVQPYL